MIRVLVVDDSALVRKVLVQELSRFDDIEVVGDAIDPYVAREKIIRLRPDVITLDVEMPRMDGLTFLELLMKHHPVPVILVSATPPDRSDRVQRALRLGAFDVVAKPGSPLTIPDVSRQLVGAIRRAASTCPRPAALDAAATPSVPSPIVPAPGFDPLRATAFDRVLAIGASTGGTTAIETILRDLPPETPGVVIVQHMPAAFTGAFARRLDGVSRLEVREASDGEVLVPGIARVAPGDRHLTVERRAGQLVTRLSDGPPVQHQRPSVDVLFESIAACDPARSVGVLLTGMGRDGARGLLLMRNAGAGTLAQDEASSVVFGMPRAAIELGAPEAVVPLTRMAAAVLDAFERPRRVERPVQSPVHPQP